MDRRRHLKAEVGLSEAARAIVQTAFAAGQKSYDAIAEEILLTTGEKIGASSIARAWRAWIAKQRAFEARDQARQLLAEFKDRPSADVEQALEALATATIYQGISANEGETLTAVQALAAHERKARRGLLTQKLAIDKDRTALLATQVATEQRRVDLLERKLAAIEAQQQAATRAVDDLVTAKQITPEVANRIRDMYGLAPRLEASAHPTEGGQA